MKNFLQNNYENQDCVEKNCQTIAREGKRKYSDPGVIQLVSFRAVREKEEKEEMFSIPFDKLMQTKYKCKTKSILGEVQS